MSANSSGEPKTATGRRAVPALAWPWAVIIAALAVFALLGWQGISTVGGTGPIDASEYLLNAQYLDQHGHLPPEYVSYEYSAPPLFEALAIALEHGVRAVPALPLELGSNLAVRILWLLIVAGSALCLVSARPRARILGIAGLTVGGLWALDETVALGRSQTWSAGQMLSLTAAMGLVVVSALIAREIWPGQPRRMLGTAAFVLAYPVVLRLGVLFHPETTIALLAAIAILLLLRAGARGWPLGLGIAAGIACGLGLLTRQSAIVVVLCLPAGALLAGGRKATRFTVGLVASAALVAGPWLGYAAATWGNPFQGNLERPGNMVPGGEPLSFYISFPARSLVVHPYRNQLANQFFPQLHADLWSDWYGAFHNTWASSSREDRVSASSQSVLGLAADALGIGGLLAFGVPPLLRLVRRQPRGPNDAALGFLALLSGAAVLALAAQIIRYPQIDGKEIKASYLMFTAPCWAIFSVAAWVAVWRWRALRIALVAAAGLYALSYGTSLAATFSHSFRPCRSCREAGLRRSRRFAQADEPDPRAWRRGQFHLVRHEPRHRHGYPRPPADPTSLRSAADRPPVLRPRIRLHRPDNRRLLPRLPAARQQLDRPVRHADREGGGKTIDATVYERGGRCPSGRQQGFTYRRGSGDSPDDECILRPSRRRGHAVREGLVPGRPAPRTGRGDGGADPTVDGPRRDHARRLGGRGRSGANRRA